METAGGFVQKAHIAVFENDDLIRQLLDQWLGEAGYRVNSGYLATAEFGNESLVIADVANPHAADPFLATLKQIYAAPIMLLSARFLSGQGASLELAQRFGVSKVLPKPFSRRDLLRAVRDAIEGN